MKKETILSRYLSYLRYVSKFVDKFKLTLILIDIKIAPFIPSKLEEILVKLLNYVTKNTIINIQDSKFKLIDAESFFIIIPAYEDWMYNYI